MAAAAAAGRRLLTQDQLHQLLLLAAHLGGHLVQVEVVAQLAHLQPHELRALEQRALEALACQAHAGPRLQLHRAAAAEVLLAVYAHMLQDRTEKHRDERRFSGDCLRVTD